MALPIPDYIFPFESTMRILITLAALVLIWAGAWRMEGRASSRYATAGLGDVVTGCSAVVVAALLARKADDAPRAAYLWCLFGIADLAVAVPMGLLTSPGRLHLLALTAPNQLVSAYPLVMVPTFGVP